MKSLTVSIIFSVIWLAWQSIAYFVLKNISYINFILAIFFPLLWLIQTSYYKDKSDKRFDRLCDDVVETIRGVKKK